MDGSSSEESVRVNTSIEACALLDRDGKIRSCEQGLRVHYLNQIGEEDEQKRKRWKEHAGKKKYDLSR